MSKTIKRLLVTGLMCLSAGVSALELKAGAPERYTVQKGDTLWGISERFTGNAWEWPDIWYQNNQIRNPHLIYPGDVIGLIEVDGQQKLTVMERGQASRTVRLSPGDVKMSPTARVEPIEAAIAAIPMDAIQGFLRGHRVIGRNDLETAPYIISGADGRVLMGAGTKVYARLPELDDDEPQPELANAYGIFRKGKLYKDPDTKEVLGLEAIDIGKARVVTASDDVVTLMLEKTNQQVSIGDQLLETEDRTLMSSFIPKAPGQRIAGKILSVNNGVSHVGQFDVVALNRGKRDGMEPGHVMLIKKAGEVVYDRFEKEKVRLPAEEAGSMMVFRVFDKMSYALIMRAQRPLKVGDIFESPQI